MSRQTQRNRPAAPHHPITINSRLDRRAVTPGALDGDPGLAPFGTTAVRGAVLPHRLREREEGLFVVAFSESPVTLEPPDRVLVRIETFRSARVNLVSGDDEVPCFFGA